jgi:hypothetical protein
MMFDIGANGLTALVFDLMRVIRRARRVSNCRMRRAAIVPYRGEFIRRFAPY